VTSSSARADQCVQPQPLPPQRAGLDANRSIKKKRLSPREVKNLLALGARATAHAGAGQFAIKLISRVLVNPDETASRDTKHRAALTVPKRILKRAVDRNRVKRVLREALRLSDALSTSASRDIMISLNAGPKKVNAAAKRHIRQAADALIGKLSLQQTAAPVAAAAGGSERGTPV
jgi:ribonuclease P protein component